MLSSNKALIKSCKFFSQHTPKTLKLEPFTEEHVTLFLTKLSNTFIPFDSLI